MSSPREQFRHLKQGGTLNTETEKLDRTSVDIFTFRFPASDSLQIKNTVRVASYINNQSCMAFHFRRTWTPICAFEPNT